MNDPTPDAPSNRNTFSFEEVISLCEQFTRTGNQPDQSRIEHYLEQVAPSARPALLRNLLAIDIGQRRASGSAPRVDDYLAQLPAEFEFVIREAFLPTYSSSVSGQVTTGPHSASALSQPQVVNRIGDYQLLRELGRGGMGIVYEACHIRRGNRVALKTLPAVSGASLHKFKREFRALSDLSHPQLVGLHTLEADGGHWFFTMDLVEGVDFLSFVRPLGSLDEGRLRAALSQLAAGVMALHGRHVIHRDLKPSNVMVTYDGQVVLLDFGLVAELDRADASLSLGQIAGTPRYMAPEQAAGDRVTGASDWYAVGAMLYESLAGTPPFQGTVHKMLHDKQHLDAPLLPTELPLPADLATLCMALLARDPQVRPDALAVAKVVSVDGTPTSAPRRGPRIVGRAEHIAALKDAFRTLERDRDPQTVFISGRSGEGKSALADHFLDWLRDERQAIVMLGRCYDRESVPFKALDTLIDALSTHLRSLSNEDAALLMPDDIGTLAQVFPVLQRVEVVAKATDPRIAALDKQQLRLRAFRALRSLLGRLSRRSPVVWFIDDLQWGDADSAAALFEVMRPPEAPTVLFLGAYRSDETQGSAFLKTWKELQQNHDTVFADREVKLAPLSVEECVELVIDLLDRDDETIRLRATEFSAETRGNPFLLIELVGCFDPETDSFEALPLHEVLTKKLTRLPAEAGGILDVVAVSGQALALEEASQTAGHTSLPVATITRMRNERLIRLIGPDESPLIDTYHDRVRETILGRMEEGKCKNLHKVLAEVIERAVGCTLRDRVATQEEGETQFDDKPIPRVYDLAYHFDAAGVRPKALAYSLRAAEQARRQSALEVATNNYEIARRNAVGTTDLLRNRMAEGYGETLMLLGRYEEAARQLEEAIDLVEDSWTKARIEALQGEIAFKQGMLKKSADTYRQALRHLGIQVPQTTVGLAYEIVRESLIQCCHTLLPGPLHRPPPSSQLDLGVRLLTRMGHVFCFQNTFKMVNMMLSGLNRVELARPTPRLAFIYAFHGTMMAMLGLKARGARYADRAMALAADFNDLMGVGNSFNYSGICFYASANYEQGLACLTEGIHAFEKAGDVWEVNLGHFHMGCCHFGLGNLSEAVAEARWAFASSARLGDSRTMCTSWLWARATRGNLPFEQLKGCIPSRPDDIMSTVHGLLAEGYWHTFHGRTAEALQHYEIAAEMVRKSLCVNSHTILVIPMLAMGLRLQADAIEAVDAKQAEQLRRRALRVAKWGARFTFLFPAAYPIALRERSLILAACGKTKQALKFADKSCAVAEVQKARYEHAQSLLVRGKLAKQLDLPGAEVQIRAATAAIEEIERPVHDSRLTAGPVQLPKSDPVVAKPPDPSVKPRRSLLETTIWGLVVAAVLAVVGATGLLAGRCAGYVIGTATGMICGDSGHARAATGAAFGGDVALLGFPVLFLAGWALIRWGQRHHERTTPWRSGAKPIPPPALLRYGLSLVLGVLAACLWMIPTALGVWLGGALSGTIGSVVCGLLVLALPLLFWWRTR